MGEWSEYFEDFPEENPANYLNGRFDPQGAKLANAQNAKVRRETEELHRTIARMAAEGRQRAAEKAKKV